MSKGKDYDAVDVIKYFCRVALGGPALGMAFGMLSLVMLRLIAKKEDNLSITCQIATTIALAYGAFFWGEHSAEVSGGFSTVTAALVIAGWGWPFFTNRHSVETV